MQKYIIFFAGLLLLVPLGAFIASYSPRIRQFVFGLLVFSTGFTDWYDINFVERWWYAGSTRGIEVSVVDLLTLVLLLSTLVTMGREGWRVYWPASLGLMLLYLGYGVMSVTFSDPKIFGLFELTKLFRGMVVFIAVAWYVRTPRDLHILSVALSAVLVYNGVFAVIQRYFWLVYRVHGTFPHSNALGDYCVLAGPIVLAAALAPVRAPIKVLCGVAWICAATATILTIARMPAAMFIVASAGVMLTGLGLKLDFRHAALVAGLVVTAGGLFYRGADKFQARQEAERYASEAASSDALRTRHYAMGFEMAKQNPFGVGLNNWGWYHHAYAERMGFPSGPSYASTSDPGEGRATQGHTLYGLTLAELGWPGLMIFGALIAQWLYLSGSLLFARPPDLCSRLVVGCFFGFVAVFVANTTEIAFRNQQIFIVFNVLVGLVVAARRLRNVLQPVVPG